MADITANATCGSLGPEMFCKLVEHVPGQPVRNAQCRICNQKSTKPTGEKVSHTHSHTRLKGTVITIIMMQEWLIRADWPDVNQSFCLK